MIAFLTTPATALMVMTLMPSLLTAARRIGLVDAPGGRKQHVGNVPLVGGIAIYLALLSISLIAGVTTSARGVLFLALAGIVVAAGMADDFCKLPAWAKLAWQVAVATLAVRCGGPTIADPAGLIGLSGTATQAFAAIGPMLSIFVYVAVMNAINLFDGADGVAGGVAAAMLMGLLLIAAENGVAGTAAAAIAFGAILGFLYFNMPVARCDRPAVFLGDAGSMLVGFTLAWFALDLLQAAPRLPSAAFAWLLGLPVLDMARVAFGRMRRGMSPFAPGREHLHHLLLAGGLSPLATALTMTGAALALAAIVFAGVCLGVGNATLALAFVFPCAAYLAAVALLRHAAAAATAAEAAAARASSAARPRHLRRAA